MPFGGMLGSTFNFVFETQLEALQNGDRFYYLARLAGLNFLTELENNSFAKLVMANTDVTHLPADIFSTPAFILEVDQSQAVQRRAWTAQPIRTRDDPVGGADLRAARASATTRRRPGPDTNYLQYTGDDHVVLGGTDGDDILIASDGDDTLWGDGGNDRLEGGDGNDNIEGGAGDDIITDTGGDDVLKGDDGNDVIHGGNGLQPDHRRRRQRLHHHRRGRLRDLRRRRATTSSSAPRSTCRRLGNEGDDWIEIGTQDGAAGDNFDPLVPTTRHRQRRLHRRRRLRRDASARAATTSSSAATARTTSTAASGFDWATYKNDRVRRHAST